MEWFDFVGTLPWNTIMQVLGLATGLLYLWWEYRADARMWFVGMVMPFISMWIYLHNGLYADFSLSIYYLVIAVYGYYRWTSRSRRARTAEATDKATTGERGETLPITHIPVGRLGMTLATFAVIWGAIYLWLRYATDSSVPVADAFTTALSIVGMWMVARKYIESWIAWFLVDAVSVGLYMYKGIPWYALLYAIYTLVCWFGWRKWQRMMQDQKLSGTGQGKDRENNNINR